MGSPNRSVAARIGERPGKILLVEDEAILRGLVAQFLRGEGFEIEEAGDGREGVDRFCSGYPFDLVLLDLNLPLLPGLEVCRRIKERRADQPVIICSAAILDDHIRGLSELNVVSFLSKPYHPSDLLARIRGELCGTSQRSEAGTAAPALAGQPWRSDRRAPRHAPAALFKLPLID